MNTSEIIDVVLWGMAAIVWCFVSAAVARHAINTSRRALRLLKMGWHCVGCNFITGPIMVPPLESAQPERKDSAPTD